MKKLYHQILLFWRKIASFEQGVLVLPAAAESYHYTVAELCLFAVPSADGKQIRSDFLHNPR